MQSILATGLKVDADLSARQFEAVKMSGTDNEVSIVSGTTDKPIGILQNKPDAAGEAAEVVIFGMSKARYGGTVNAGDLLSVDGDGELVAVVAGTDTTRYVIAQALEDGADQEVHQVLVCAAPFRAA